MKATSLILTAFLLVFSACSQKQEATVDTMETDFEMVEMTTAKMNLEEVCNVCHSPTAAPDDRLAPPMEIVKRNYISLTNSKEEFSEKMVQFILRPSAEQSELHSDVEEFGLMDPVGFSEADIREIAEYIYDNELEKPDWLMDN